MLNEFQYETFADQLREIGCSEVTIGALWKERWITDLTVLNRGPPKKSNSDWEEIQPPSEEAAHSATFWYNKKTGKVWARLKGG